MSNNPVAICAIVFLALLFICVCVALWYNPAPCEVVKPPCPKSPSDLLAERIKCRSSPAKTCLTPLNRDSLPCSPDGSPNNDPWAILDKVDDERMIKHRPAM